MKFIGKKLSGYLVVALIAMFAAQAHAQEMYRLETLPGQREFTYKVSAGDPQVNTFFFESGIDMSPVKGSPYTAKAVTTTTQTLADGNKIKHTSEVELARDSEGRTRREQSLANLGPWETNNKGSIITINDPVAHVRYEMQRDGDKTIASKTQPVERMRIEREARAMAEAQVHEGHGSGTGVGVGIGDEPGKDKQIVIVTAGSENNVGYTVGQRAVESTEPKNTRVDDLGTQVIEGVSAQGTRKTITIPAGQVGNEQPINIVSETWFSPELKLTVMSKRNDPRVGETDFKLTNIQRGEPDASLFQLPPGTEVNLPKVRQREF